MLMDEGYALGNGDVKTAAQLLVENADLDLRDYFLKGGQKQVTKRRVNPKSVNQRKYLDAIEQHDIVFGVGPAGTGKTYLAMAQAVSYLLAKKVSRIILARPAVEAGEKLGFLPGDLQEKVNPYLRPLYDALYDMMDTEKATRLVERGTIEVAPIAFMRGRTLNDAFVILDEAQNTTSEQMKMFLTRLGFGSKAVVTGDITQIDLPNPRASGLVEALQDREERRGDRLRVLRRQATSCATSSCSRSSRRTTPTRTPARMADGDLARPEDRREDRGRPFPPCGRRRRREWRPRAGLGRMARRRRAGPRARQP